MLKTRFSASNLKLDQGGERGTFRAPTTFLGQTAPMMADVATFSGNEVNAMKNVLLKNAAAITLGCALLSAPVLADNMNTTATPGATQTAAAGISASEMIGTNLQNASGETIGEVNDLVLDGNGDTQGVVVDVGGFLGVGARSVLVDWDSLTVTEQDNELKVTTALSREQLEQLQPYEGSSRFSLD